jgi:hypothetical protein
MLFLLPRKIEWNLEEEGKKKRKKERKKESR